LQEALPHAILTEGYLGRTSAAFYCWMMHCTQGRQIVEKRNPMPKLPKTDLRDTQPPLSGKSRLKFNLTAAVQL